MPSTTVTTTKPKKAAPKSSHKRAVSVTSVVSSDSEDTLDANKKPGAGAKKKKAKSGPDEVALKTLAVGNVPWSDPKWARLTERLIAILQEDPDLRAKLFSDSNKAAKAESRDLVTNKSTKVALCEEVARSVFRDEPMFSERAKTEKGLKAFGLSVNGRLAK